MPSTRWTQSAKPVKCWHCKSHHNTVAEVRECAAEMYDAIASQRAEIEAEMGYERWLEDGGPHADRLAWEQQQEDQRFF